MRQTACRAIDARIVCQIIGGFSRRSRRVDPHRRGRRIHRSRRLPASGRSRATSVAALPEDTPRPPCLHVRGLGDRALAILARCPFPDGANLEDLDTLACDPKPEIELGSEVRRRAAALDELSDDSLDPRSLDVCECPAYFRDRLGWRSSNARSRCPRLMR
jgi:hypothetical protein